MVGFTVCATYFAFGMFASTSRGREREGVSR